MTSSLVSEYTFRKNPNMMLKVVIEYKNIMFSSMAICRRSPKQILISKLIIRRYCKFIGTNLIFIRGLARALIWRVWFFPTIVHRRMSDRYFMLVVCNIKNCFKDILFFYVKLSAVMNWRTRTFRHTYYVADVTVQFILRLDI